MRRSTPDCDNCGTDTESVHIEEYEDYVIYLCQNCYLAGVEISDILEKCLEISNINSREEKEK